MKTYIAFINTIYRTLCTISIALLCHAPVHGQQAQSPILGEWALDYGTTSNAATGNGKARFEAMDTGTKQQVAGFYQGRRFTFLADGTYRMGAIGRPDRNGSWTLADGTLALTDAGNAQKLVYSASLTNTHLVLRLEGTGAGNALFRNLYLKPAP